MMKTLSLHMQTNNGVSTNMGIVYVAPVQNKAGIQNCDKDYQLLAYGRWFSPSTPASSTTKTTRHEIAEILLKVALNTKNQHQSIKSIRCTQTWVLSMWPLSKIKRAYKMIHFMVNLSDHEVQCHNNKNSY
jgi:hypothetical protein